MIDSIPKKVSLVRAQKCYTVSVLHMKINRIYHRSSVQTEKSQPEGKRIMPETRFTCFPTLSVDLRIGIFGLHRRPMIDYFSYTYHWKICSFKKNIYTKVV